MIRTFLLTLIQTNMTMKNVHLENPPHLLQNPTENQPLNYILSIWNRASCNPNREKANQMFREAIISLRKNKDIVISEADKGGAVVVMNKNDYISEAKNSVHADGNRIYEELSFDCTQKFVRDVSKAIEKGTASTVIDDELAEPLIVDSPKPGNIYFLPKIHKDTRPPPGRPICNTINSPAMNLSKWVDMQHQPLVKKLPSYFKDNNDFLRKINELNDKQTIPQNALLVTWDVKSLCTNSLYKEGLEAFKITLENENMSQKKIETILDFSKLVLSCNHFKFLGQNYLQRSGTAMGTKMALAPSYANIFMGIFEKQMLST